jgi:hypothetical protein
MPNNQIIPYLKLELFIILGYSMIQGGPLPCFMHDSLTNKLFGQVPYEELSRAEKQVRDGLMRFGLAEVQQLKRQ